MDRVWTPWRFAYISSGPESDECVFCHLEAADESDDEENLILLRQRYAYVVLNKYPYTAGHLMIVSRRHLANLEAARQEELSEIIDLARSCECALRQAFQPDGFNIGFNLGKSAGAGVAGHLHLHVVPRWTGDANFVSVIGETRVIPEGLESTFLKLMPHLHKKADIK